MKLIISGALICVLRGQEIPAGAAPREVVILKPDVLCRAEESVFVFTVGERQILRCAQNDVITSVFLQPPTSENQLHSELNFAVVDVCRVDLAGVAAAGSAGAEQAHQRDSEVCMIQ